MSELEQSEIMELPINPEKESGAVKRVAEKVGTFLSETYTKKGALKKEMAQYEKIFNRFTGAQRQEMKAFYEKQANKSATFKLIRNWVVTGAGLALGGAAALRPDLAVLAVKGLAGWIVSTGKNLIAEPGKIMGKIGAGIGAGLEATGKAVTSVKDGIYHWMFNTNLHQPITIDVRGANKVVTGARDTWQGIEKSFEPVGKTLSAVGKFVREGPQQPLPYLQYKTH